MCATKKPQSNITITELKAREAQYSYLLKLAKEIKTQTAVLYRDNESILPLVDILERESVSYRIKSVDMAFFTHRVVIDVVNMLRFSLYPADQELFMKIYFKFQAFLRKPDAEIMCQVADERHTGIWDAAEYLDINKRVLGNCRSLRTHFGNMAQETPYKAINRLENYMGYGEYLEANNIDKNKIFILKMLAKNEKTIESFLERLEQLRVLLAEKKPEYSAKLILSTIHSSKGLEYDSVILIDVINGVFPSKVIREKDKSATSQDRRDFEEERRIFYVGMTRARDNLNIFKYDDKPSAFVKELTAKEKEDRPAKKKKASLKEPTMLLKKKNPKAVAPSAEIPEQLIIGDRITQAKYGEGTITDVTYDDDEIPLKFSVQFDSGDEKIFLYPVAFNMGMRIIH
jgi:DNA helicase-2/ATP-dependent DNA helicase PcrA